MASATVLAAATESTRQTVTWGPYDRKDPMTDKVRHQIAGQIDFPDGNMVQVYARCGENVVGERYPGLMIAIGVFYESNSAPKAFGWINKALEVPLLVNEQAHSAVHAYTNDPRSNFIGIGFYDPASAKRYAHVRQSGLMRLPELAGAAAVQQGIAWDNFLAGTGGTLADLLKATSVRIRLPISDGSANVVELNPQDEVLRKYVQQCSNGF